MLLTLPHNLSSNQASRPHCLCVCPCLCVCVCECVPTLRANQHQRQVRRVPVGGEAAEVVVDGLEADLVLQAEDEDYGVHPQRKLHTHNHNNNTTLYTSCFQTKPSLLLCCCSVQMNRWTTSTHPYRVLNKAITRYRITLIFSPTAVLIFKEHSSPCFP